MFRAILILVACFVFFFQGMVWGVKAQVVEIDDAHPLADRLYTALETLADFGKVDTAFIHALAFGLMILAMWI